MCRIPTVLTPKTDVYAIVRIETRSATKPMATPRIWGGILDRMADIRISEAHHGPPAARRSRR